MTLNSPFPKQNRKIYYMPVAKMNYDNKRQAFDKFVPWIQKIVKKNAANKGIIHTVSFELATWIKDELEKDKSQEGVALRKRFLFHDSATRDIVLRQHTASKEPTILVSPSMFTGVDLKDDLSRFQIILKIPYPNLGAAKIKKRKDIYPAWYGWRTVADIVQSYGRSVRNMEDWAETYILDAGFGNLMSYNGHFIPKYMKEAIVTIKV
jgi:Rad3-related DNA helicase